MTSKHPIVGLGASAGGIPALEGFFRALADENGMGFVIVTHLSPDRRSRLYEIIARHTSMPVHIAKDGAEVLPNSVHVMPEGKVLTIHNGRLQVRDDDPMHRERKWPAPEFGLHRNGRCDQDTPSPCFAQTRIAPLDPPLRGAIIVADEGVAE